MNFVINLARDLFPAKKSDTAIIESLANAPLTLTQEELENADTTYRCRTCSTKGRLGQMYSVGRLDMRSATVADLERAIACFRCAMKAAGQKGLRVGEAGSDTYPLRHTIKKFLELAPVRDAKAAEKKMQAELDASIADYAEAVAMCNATEVEYGLPGRRLVGDKVVCGLPAEIACCDKRRPASMFVPIGTDIVGVCQRTSQIFWMVYKELAQEGEVLYHPRIQAFKLEQVERIVARRRASLDLEQYALAYAHSAEGEMDWPSRLTNSEEVILCGMPMSCCSHAQPAFAFILLPNESIAGICREAATAFRNAQESAPAFERHPRLLWAKEVATLERVLQARRERAEQEAVWASRGVNGFHNHALSPLANKTDREAGERRKQRVRDRSETDYLARTGKKSGQKDKNKDGGKGKKHK